MTTLSRDNSEAESLTEKLVSTSEVSRLLNMPVARIRRAVTLGALTPKQVCLDGRLHLWSVGDLSTIRARVETLDAVRNEESETLPA